VALLSALGLAPGRMRHAGPTLRAIGALASALALAAPAAVAGAQQRVSLERWPEAPRPRAPVIRNGACPFECCRYGRWTLREPAVARRRPSRSAPVAYRLATGAKLVADTGFVRIDTIGLIVLRENYVDRMNGIPYVAGDTLLVLDYVGENVFNAWLRGRAIQTEVFWLNDDPERPRELPGRVVRDHSSQWWARVRDRRGRTGWVDMAKTAVSGSDGCGG
ncbi:MAG: hypothetical protein ABR499_22370, partial [Gemmatimonadaceae bacterium]